jgi:hypothetical protein
MLSLIYPDHLGTIVQGKALLLGHSGSLCTTVYCRLHLCFT